MLPNINATDGDKVQQGILIGSGGDLQALGGGVQTLDSKLEYAIIIRIDTTHKPSPSRSLNTKSSRVEFLLQVVEATKRLDNGILQWAIFQNATIALFLRGSRGKILPEQRVVDMS